MKKLTVLLLLLTALPCFTAKDDKEIKKNIKEGGKKINIEKFLLITEIAKQAEFENTTLEHTIKRLFYDVDKKEKAKWEATLKGLKGYSPCIEGIVYEGIVYNDSSSNIFQYSTKEFTFGCTL